MALKRAAMVCIAVALFSEAGYAANCSPHPYTLTNGTTADASQVMADFNNLLNCSNNNLAPITNPTFSGTLSINPAATLALDVNSVGRFVTPSGYGSTGGVVIRGASDAESAILQFVSNSNAAQYAFIKGSGGGLNITGGLIGINTDTPSLQFFVNGSQNWTVASDARLKKDIVQISGALSLVQQLRGVRYNWRSEDERSVGKKLTLATNQPQLGFIAQEVEKVVPEAVSAPKDADGLYGLKESELIPLLVEAIKEQQKQIDQLRASLAKQGPVAKP